MWFLFKDQTCGTSAWAKLDKKQNRRKLEDSGCSGIITFDSEMKQKKKLVRKQQLDRVKNLSNVMEKFLKVLLEEKVEVKRHFLQWLKFYFVDFSQKNLPDLQRECQVIRDLLRSKDIQDQEMKELQKSLQEQAKNLINASFGPEHLFRELAQL